ncbi:MAG: adenine deaminase [Candidatus Micrarchaeota archaeon]
MRISGNLVDVVKGTIYPAEIEFDGKIQRICRIASAPNRYILPGLVDGHMHVESTMLLPSEYARVAASHGVVAAVADPHEIGNVLGERGVRFMIRDGRESCFKFFFGAPSCVPATKFETSGAHLGPREIERLLSRKDVSHLSEMMDYPGVIARRKDIMAKISSARRHGKKVDGHAPGLSGKDLDRYIAAGIGTDHECYMLAEAEEKAGKGMKILVREGSAAKNLSTLYPILHKGRNMLCTDDMEPGDLLDGHMDSILAKCVRLGIKPLDAIRCCTRNPCEHYNLGTGLLRIGDPADIAVVQDLRSFRVIETFVDGMRAYPLGGRTPAHRTGRPLNNFHARRISAKDISFFPQGRYPVIEAVDGELITEKRIIDAADFKAKRVQKIVVINRYRKAKPAVGFIRDFSIRRGAFGSSVMHDSHNIGVIGADDESICTTANAIIANKGGLAVYDGKRVRVLPLPYAGLMSGERAESVAKKYEGLKQIVKRMGCRMKAPFMTLSFMGLLVIPHIKISDRGLFDGDRFGFI